MRVSIVMFHTENVDIQGILKIQDRDVLGEITQAKSDITELKNDARVVNLTVTGDASFNGDVPFSENLDIEGIPKIQNRDVLGEIIDINGRVVELETNPNGGGGGLDDDLNFTGT